MPRASFSLSTSMKTLLITCRERSSSGRRDSDSAMAVPAFHGLAGIENRILGEQRDEVVVVAEVHGAGVGDGERFAGLLDGF